MKLEIIIDKCREETVTVVAHEKNRLVHAIEKLIEENDAQLIGYIEREAIRLSATDIYCFIVETGRVYALTDKGRLSMRCRLYVLEEALPDSFIKINQSCIVNIKQIERFSGTFSGALQVTLKNGYTDYVSRRNVKKIKERLGL